MWNHRAREETQARARIRADRPHFVSLSMAFVSRVTEVFASSKAQSSLWFSRASEHQRAELYSRLQAGLGSADRETGF
jgi:hypothetical protein